jgi:hypothetical protein
MLRKKKFGEEKSKLIFIGRNLAQKVAKKSDIEDDEYELLI